MLGPGQAQLDLVFVEFTKSTDRSRRQWRSTEYTATPPSSAKHATQSKHTGGGEGGMVHCMWTGHAFLAHHDRADSPTSLANISLSSLHFAPISQHSPARRPRGLRGPGCGLCAAVKRRQAPQSTPCSVELIWSREISTDLPCPLAKPITSCRSAIFRLKF